MLESGRRVRLLAVVADFTRACLAIEVDTSIGGHRVVQVLERVIAERGRPAFPMMDNGPEFVGRPLDSWAYAHGIQLHFIEPRKPNQNAYVESFNGRLRDECLTLVSESGESSGHHRGLAPRLQWPPPSQLPGQRAARGVRAAHP